MIYQTFKNSVEKRVPVTHEEFEMLKKLNHVDPSKRIKLSSKKIYAQHTPQSAEIHNPEIQNKEEMIYNLVPREQLKMMNDDPEGAPRLLEYIDKLVDNLYTFSQELYNKRTTLKIVSKLRERKLLQNKIRASMPQYCEVLKKQEMQEINKRNIDLELLKDEY